MAQLGQLGLQQGMVARVVHEREMVLELGVEPDREEIPDERYRVCLDQVASGKRADPAHRFEDGRP